MEGPGLPGEPERAKFYVVRALAATPASSPCSKRMRISPRSAPCAPWRFDRDRDRRGRGAAPVRRRGMDRRAGRPGGGGVAWTAGANASVRAAARDRLPHPRDRSGVPGRRPAALDGSLEASTCRNRSSWDSRTNIGAAKMAYPGPDDFSAVAYAAWDESAPTGGGRDQAGSRVAAGRRTALKLDNEPARSIPTAAGVCRRGPPSLG